MATWNEAKRLSNLEEHGIDFNDLDEVFEFPMLTIEDDRRAYGEQRLQSLAWLRGRVVFMVWVDRELDVHIISCREATKHETKQYFKDIQ
ncbi:BrnT family toxin [Thiofilum flexile]|uniref:BrnT family toxin n=1 Tax=Thiofilum flexile TaxID=125627 RepID=UPI0003663A0B|nr:BrnT family toxin [Thiofilum flexile]